MNINLYIVIILLFVALIIKLIPVKDKNKCFLITSFIILFVILIIREPYSDMIKYNEVFRTLSFDNYKLYIEKGNWEPLYVLLNLFIKIFTSNDRIFMVILSIITLSGSFLFIKRYCDNYLIGIIFLIVLGIFHYNFFIMRQAIAMSIIFMSVRFIEDKKPIKFILMVLLAACFHKTALVFLISYPVCNIKISSKLYLLYYPILFIIFLLKKNILILTGVLNMDRYSSYKLISYSSDGISRLLLLLMIFIVIHVIELLKNKNTNEILFRKRDKEDTTTLFINMFALAIIFQVLALQMSLIVRMTMYFVISGIIIVSNIINSFKYKKERKFISSIIIICSLLMLYYINESNYSINIF